MPRTLSTICSTTLGPSGATGKVLRLVPAAPPGRRVPGDCNADRVLDIFVQDEEGFLVPEHVEAPRFEATMRQPEQKA